MSRYRATVEAWRWDYLSPRGFFPWTVGVPRELEAIGFFRWREAACNVEPSTLHQVAVMCGGPHPADHEAPDPDCVCGLHAVTDLTLDVADALADLAATRDLLAVDDPNVGDWMSVALSKVTLTRVLPGAWPWQDADAHRRLGAIADPPGTIRGHRMAYREILVDREWQTEEFPKALPDWWPPMQYVPDLAEWVRGQCAASVADLLPGGTE